jgi:hypothetical protein
MTGMLLSDTCVGSTMSVTAKTAFSAGSSQHGSARRQSVA